MSKIRAANFLARSKFVSLINSMKENRMRRMTIEDLLLDDPDDGPEERQKRDRAMLEVQFLINFLKKPDNDKNRRRRNSRQGRDQ
jgi:hypothetical protein